MSDRLKSVIKYTLSTFLTLFFLYLAFRGTDFDKLWEILRGANYWWALAMFPLLLLSHYVRAWRWAYFLYPVKSDLKLRNLFSATMVGYMLNNLLPRAGELVRPYAINKLEGVSRSTAFGTVLMERIFDVASFVLVVALIPLVYSGPLAETFPWLEETGMWISIATIATLAMFTFLMMRRDFVERLLAKLTKRLSARTAQTVEHITHSFLDGFLFLRNARHYVQIIIMSIVIWGLYIVMMYLPFYAFGLVDRYGLDLGSALVVHAISSIGFVMPTPGATGPYHYFAIQTLTQLYHVDQEVARSYATLTHAIGFIGVIIIGLYYFFRDRLHMADVMRRDVSQTLGQTGPQELKRVP
jgi:uncharacterized protein (TIRG00374 family)